MARVNIGILGISELKWTVMGEFDSDGKASTYNAGELGSVPGLGKFPGEGNGNPLQYSFQGRPMSRGAW